MNYSSLQNLLPAYFRIVGYLLAVLSLMVSLLIKFEIYLLPEIIPLKIVQSIFLISFILMLASRSNTEDERVATIRLAISSYGFYALISFIIIMEMFGILAEYTFTFNNIYDSILCYTILLVFAYEILSRTNLIDFIEQNKKDLRYYAPILGFLGMFILLGIMKLNSWLWGWSYFG